MFKMIMSFVLVLGLFCSPLSAASDSDSTGVRFQRPGPAWDRLLDFNQDPLYHFENYVFQGRLIGGRIIPLDEESPEQWIRDEITSKTRSFGSDKAKKASECKVETLTAGKNVWRCVQFPDSKPGVTTVQYYYVFPGGLVEVGVMRANEDAQDERFGAFINRLLASFQIDEVPLDVFLKEGELIRSESNRIFNLTEDQQVAAFDRLIAGLTNTRVRLYAMQIKLDLLLKLNHVDECIAAAEQLIAATDDQMFLAPAFGVYIEARAIRKGDSAGTARFLLNQFEKRRFEILVPYLLKTYSYRALQEGVSKGMAERLLSLGALTVRVWGGRAEQLYPGLTDTLVMLVEMYNREFLSQKAEFDQSHRVALRNPGESGQESITRQSAWALKANKDEIAANYDELVEAFVPDKKEIERALAVLRKLKTLDLSGLGFQGEDIVYTGYTDIGGRSAIINGRFYRLGEAFGSSKIVSFDEKSFDLGKPDGKTKSFSVLTGM